MLRYLASLMLILASSLFIAGCGGEPDKPSTDDATGTPGDAGDVGGEATTGSGTADDASSNAGAAVDAATGDTTGAVDESAGAASGTAEGGAKIGLGALTDAIRAGAEDTLAGESTAPAP